MAQTAPRSVVARPLDNLAYVAAPVGWAPDLPAMETGEYAMLLDNFVPKTGRLTLRNPVYSDYGDWVNDATVAPSLGLTQNQSFAVRGSLALLGIETTTPVGVSNSTASTSQQQNGGSFGWTYHAESPPYPSFYECEITATGYPSWMLTMTGCGFSIPSNATIKGVHVTAAVSSVHYTGTVIIDHSVRLLNGGVISGAERGNAGYRWDRVQYPSTANNTYGGSSDLWGLALTPAIVNNSGFGVGVSCVCANMGSGGLNPAALVTAIEITVYYTLPIGNGGAVALCSVSNQGTYGTSVLSRDESLWARPSAAATIRARSVIPVLGEGTPYWSSQPTPISAPHGAIETTQYFAPGKSSASLYGLVWFVSTPMADDNLSNSSYYIGRTRLGYMSPTSINTLNELSGTTTIPTNATAVYAYQSRLWVLGGYAGSAGLSSFSTTALFFSNPVAPASPTTPATAAAWTDPTAGTENVIYIDPDEENPGLGLASFNNRLIIFRRHSIYVLTGTTPANYTVTLLSRSYGCLDQESIVETDHGVYFMSENGLCLTTGTSVANVSGMAQESITAAMNLYVQNPGGDITSVLLADNSILISIRALSNDQVSSTTIWSGAYNPDTGAWWRLTSVLFGGLDSTPDVTATEDGLPGRLIEMREAQKCVSIGGRRAVDIDYAVAGTASGTPSFLIGIGNDRDATRQTLFDYSNNFTQTGITGQLPIPGRWLSGFVPLTGAAQFMSTGVRCWTDYLYTASTPGGITAPMDLLCSLVDTSGNIVASMTLAATLMSGTNRPYPTLPATGMSSYLPNEPLTQGWPLVQRATEDFGNEIDHVQVMVDLLGLWSGSVDTNIYQLLDIYGVGVEYQPARNLR